jgi:hypothetical protein
MAEFNWSVPMTEYTKADGGIFTVHWRVSASETVGEDTFSASSYGTCGFTPDASAPDFVAYDSLTEATVLGWVWADGVDKDATEAALQAKIDADKNPTTGAGVPWTVS